MATLTGLAPDPRQPGYRLVDIDRGRFASIPADALAGLGLVVGRSLDARTLARLTELADLESAFRAGMRALARRAYATRDLRRRLIQRPHTLPAVDAALERLAQRGLLDDARFAVDYARQRARRGRGPARLLRDLMTQGVERRLAEQAIQEALQEEGIEPREVARRVARVRANALRALPPDVLRRRLAAFLARRGFTGAAIQDVVREVVSSA